MFTDAQKLVMEVIKFVVTGYSPYVHNSTEVIMPVITLYVHIST